MRIALVGALGCAALATLTWAAAFGSHAGHALDVWALTAIYPLKETRVQPLAVLVGDLCDPLPYGVMSALVTTWALLARGARGAVVVATLLVVPNAISQVLKVELADPRASPVSVDAAAWPSGHATAAMSLAVAVVLLAPARWRGRVAVLGALFVAAMSATVVVLGWHFPSDALGGVAIAAAGGCVAAGLLSRRAATTAHPGRWRLARG